MVKVKYFMKNKNEIDFLNTECTILEAIDLIEKKNSNFILIIDYYTKEPVGYLNPLIILKNCFQNFKQNSENEKKNDENKNNEKIDNINDLNINNLNNNIIKIEKNISNEIKNETEKKNFLNLSYFLKKKV
jgi:hypothetical protein